MEQAKIDRINELYKKSVSIGLSETEKEEQQALRQEYIKEIRSGFKATLESVKIVEEDGTIRNLKTKQP